MKAKEYENMYDSNISGLERSRRYTEQAVKEVQKRKEKENKIKQEKTDAVNNQINELGRIPIQKGDDCTIICDGATMKCNMGIFGSMVQNISSKIVLMKPDFTAVDDDEAIGELFEYLDKMGCKKEIDRYEFENFVDEISFSEKPKIFKTLKWYIETNKIGFLELIEGERDRIYISEKEVLKVFEEIFDI